MMAGGMPPQNINMNLNTMQRPQTGNVAQQLHARIVSFFESGVVSGYADHYQDGLASAQNGSASSGMAVNV